MDVQVAEPLRALVAAVDGLVADGVGADGDVLAALSAQLSRLELVASRGAVGFDAGERWRDDGGQSSPVWLAHATHDPMRVPRRLARGQVLERMPLVAAAWAAGTIGPDHVDVFAATWRPERRRGVRS